jgi:hypothetical protein
MLMLDACKHLTAYYLVIRWEDLWIWITCATAGVGFVLVGTGLVRWAGAA